MKIAIEQNISFIGDISGNLKKIKKAIQQAKEELADIIIFPRLFLTGYPTFDLLLDENFINECKSALTNIVKLSENIAVVIDIPFDDNGLLKDRLFFIYNKNIVGFHDNTSITGTSPFQEERYFSNGDVHFPEIDFKQKKITCIFAAEFNTYTSGYRNFSDLIICIDARAYGFEIESTFPEQLSLQARVLNCNIINVNAAGGHIPYIFAGNSCFVTKQGNVSDCLKKFEADSKIVDLNNPKNTTAIISSTPIADIHDALVCGIRDYFVQNNFKDAILGLSGGIDSAVVLALAVKALKHNHVKVLLMPSEFSSGHSVDDSVEMAERLRIEYYILPIHNIYKQTCSELSPIFKDLPFGLAEENLQARIRGDLVMSMANKFNILALNTSNKSESAVGYGTLYGDLCGSLSVIGDLYKSQVYDLARFINKKTEWIPANIINKAPSAELRPNQKDSDSLPDYDVLDKILYLFINKKMTPKSIIEKGFDKSTVIRIITLVNRNEYKRAQVPPVLKVSDHAFGIDRIYPLTFKF